MTTPSSGAISLYNVERELGYGGGTNISLGQTAVRQLAGVGGGAVSLSNLYNKTNLRWGDTGSTYHPYVNLSGSTFTSENAAFDIYGSTDGAYVVFSVPNDNGGSPAFTTTYLAASASAGNYKVRFYVGAGLMADPYGTLIYPGNYSSWLTIGTNDWYYQVVSDTSATVQIYSTDETQGMQFDFHCHIDYVA